MSRHRLQEAPTIEATVELVAAPRPRRASGAPRPAGELDRAALAKEILAAVDDRIPLSEDVRTGETIGGNRPVACAVATRGADATDGADAGAARGSRHQRPSAARRPRWVRRRGTTMLLVAGLVVGLVAVPAAGLAAAGPCRLQQVAHQLILDLGGTQAPFDPCGRAAEVGPVDAAVTTAADDLSFDRRAAASARPTPGSATRPTTAPAHRPTTPPPARPATKPAP